MLESVNRVLSGMILPPFLLGVGVFFAARLRLFHFRRLPIIYRALTRKGQGERASSFRSLTLALAGTLGVGNIVGVASAIALGGPGAVFWMWISAIAAMFLKYAEVVLGMRYRKRGDGGFHGGAPYYISEGLSARGRARLGKALAAVFAFLCILDSFTTGGSIQSAAVSGALAGVMGIPPALSGGILAVICAVLLMRGTGVIMRVTEVLVPVMCAGFLFLSVWCMAAQPQKIGEAIGLIFRDAFTPSSAFGGVGGFLFSRAARFGTMRGLLSNEAGCGTSPFAHAVADAKSPAEQGFWGIFEVFVDTILLCTVTAVVIIMNGEAVSGFSDVPIMMAIRAYSRGFEGIWASVVEDFLGLSLLCFGFATLLCWAHYGLACVDYLFGNKHLRILYIFAFGGMILFGSLTPQNEVFALADLVMGLMLLLHLPVLCVLNGEVQKQTRDYFGK